uniref:J domain-containing protein n=1 Tax=Acrobeloides nanus TaxID=290746 RepID=A0A914DLD8_9BILA
MDSDFPDNINLYELLGCNKTSTPDQINAEYKARVRDFHPDKVDDSEKETAERQFRLLTTAKDILCDQNKRKHYDMYLSMGSQMSLKEWMDNQEKLQQTMHWVQLKEPTPMIAGTQNLNGQNQKREGWKSHESATLQAFRSYKI